MAVPRNVSDVTGFIEATPDSSPMGDSAPEIGTLLPRTKIEGLGYLEDFETNVNKMRTTGDKGQAFVVLVDSLATPDQEGRVKGQIIHLVDLDPDFDKPKRDKNETAKIVRRLLELNAIRLADSEEATKDRVEVTESNETPEVRAERQKRIELENEIKALKGETTEEVDDEE